MATVEVTVRVSMRHEDMSLKEIENAVGEAVEQAGRDLLSRACQVLEDGLLEQEHCGWRKP